jgi:hypothetical protein
MSGWELGGVRLPVAHFWEALIHQVQPLGGPVQLGPSVLGDPRESDGKRWRVALARVGERPSVSFCPFSRQLDTRLCPKRKAC